MFKRDNMEKEWSDLVNSESITYSESRDFAKFSFLNIKEDMGMIEEEDTDQSSNCPIYSLLMAVFANQRLNDKQISDVSHAHIPALRTLLSKKFVFADLRSPFELIRGNRRTEDQFKFVFRKGIKNMIRKYKEKQGMGKASKLETELSFYQFYFGESALTTDTSLESFYLPGSKAQRSTTHSTNHVDKTLSFAYTQRILNSSKFRREFTRYLLEGFLEDCFAMRREQLLKIAHHIKETRSKLPKLPWSNEEIMDAQNRLIDIVTKIGYNPD